MRRILIGIAIVAAVVALGIALFTIDISVREWDITLTTKEFGRTKQIWSFSLLIFANTLHFISIFVDE